MLTRKKSIYVFYYEWPNTAGNHAGMAHFFRCLKRKISMSVKLIKGPKNYSKWPYRLRRVWQKFLVRYVKFLINSKDIIFFTEYLGGKKPGDHTSMASELCEIVDNPIVGLIHLPFQTLTELYDYDYINNSLETVDRVITFGSSLTKDLSNLGFGNKVVRTFHYVDIEFYVPGNRNFNNDNFTVIVMGFLYRNRSKLSEIIKHCPTITFDLCLGNNDELHRTFEKFKNVKLNKFLPESELLNKMQQADVSLSVFDDTIGSNVITTSLACGLPQIVSDVGSIRDYCSHENTIFCTTNKEFIDAINFLSTKREICKLMGLNARKKAEEISLEKSVAWYKHFFLSISK